MFCGRKDKHVFLGTEVMFAKTLLPWGLCNNYLEGGCETRFFFGGGGHRETSQLERGGLGVKFYIQGGGLLLHKLEK